MSYHVVPNGKKWRVVMSGGGQIGPDFDTQSQAQAYATNLSRSHQEELFIHRPNGRIRERNSYGNDPYPPKG